MIRKAIAGALIRAAHKIYRPTVTELVKSVDQIIVGDNVIALADVDDYIARRDRLNSLVGY